MRFATHSRRATTSLEFRAAAYAARHRTLPEQQAASTSGQAVLEMKLGQALVKVDAVATQVFHGFASLTWPEKQELLRELRQAISQLQDHVLRLAAELEASPAAAE